MNLLQQCLVYPFGHPILVWCLLTVKCLSMPSSRHRCRKRSLVYSLPLFEQDTLIFLLIFFSIFLFHFTNKFFSFVSHDIYPILPREIINKGHKVVVISHKCRLGRSPNICVNIVKNVLDAMNRGAEFYLGLLADEVILTKLQFACLGILQ